MGDKTPKDRPPPPLRFPTVAEIQGRNRTRRNASSVQDDLLEQQLELISALSEAWIEKVRELNDRLVKLPPSNPTPDPLSKKAPDKPLDERVWRVPPRKPTTIPTRRKL